METSEVIITIAQLAFAVAGLSGVIIALRPQPIKEWTLDDKTSFRIIIQVSLLLVFFSIFPFGMHILFDEDLAWKISLLIYGSVHLLDVISFSIVSLNRKKVRASVMLPPGFVIAFIQIMCGVYGSPEWVEFTYLAVLVWHLFVSIAGFVLLLYKG